MWIKVLIVILCGILFIKIIKMLNKIFLRQKPNNCISFKDVYNLKWEDCNCSDIKRTPCKSEKIIFEISIGEFLHRGITTLNYDFQIKKDSEDWVSLKRDSLTVESTDSTFKKILTFETNKDNYKDKFYRVLVSTNVNQAYKQVGKILLCTRMERPKTPKAEFFFTNPANTDNNKETILPLVITSNSGYGGLNLDVGYTVEADSEVNRYVKNSRVIYQRDNGNDWEDFVQFTSNQLVLNRRGIIDKNGVHYVSYSDGSNATVKYRLKFILEYDDFETDEFYSNEITSYFLGNYLFNAFRTGEITGDNSYSPFKPEESKYRLVSIINENLGIVNRYSESIVVTTSYQDIDADNGINSDIKTITKNINVPLSSTDIIQLFNICDLTTGNKLSNTITRVFDVSVTYNPKDKSKNPISSNTRGDEKAKLNFSYKLKGSDPVCKENELNDGTYPFEYTNRTYYVNSVPCKTEKNLKDDLYIQGGNSKAICDNTPEEKPDFLFVSFKYYDPKYDQEVKYQNVPNILFKLIQEEVITRDGYSSERPYLTKRCNDDCYLNIEAKTVSSVEKVGSRIKNDPNIDNALSPFTNNYLHKISLSQPQFEIIDPSLKVYDAYKLNTQSDDAEYNILEDFPNYRLGGDFITYDPSLMHILMGTSNYNLVEDAPVGVKRYTMCINLKALYKRYEYLKSKGITFYGNSFHLNFNTKWGEGEQRKTFSFGTSGEFNCPFYSIDVDFYKGGKIDYISDTFDSENNVVDSKMFGLKNVDGTFIKKRNFITTDQKPSPHITGFSIAIDLENKDIRFNLS